MSDERLEWARAWPETGCRAFFRKDVTDFQVEEVLGFEPEGHGEHVLLWVEKTDLNTDDVAHRIARLSGVRRMDIGFCGMKDRRARTRQWFSVYLANRPEPDWSRLNGEDMTVLRVSRHRQKLRRGQHLANAFEIRLRQVRGDRALLEQNLEQVRDQGFPNYFGEQRFGIRGANLDRAENLFRGELRQRDRHKRGIYLSAARSWLFNHLLSRRVAAGVWDRILPGDLLAAVPKTGLAQTEDVPSGPLYGDAPLATSAEARDWEQGVADDFGLFIEGLKAQRLQPERRPLVAYPMGLSWEWRDDDLILRFTLTSGTFATALLRECLALDSDYWKDDPAADGDAPAEAGRQTETDA